MPYIKGALHVHTNLSDGSLVPTEMLKVYRDLGFGFMAFTDHDYQVGSNQKYLTALPDGGKDFIVFKGLEVEWAEINYAHISKIWGDQELLVIFNHPAQYRMEIPEVLRRIEVVNKTLKVDAIEVTHKGRYFAQYNVREISLPKVATDDSHHADECGWAWIEVEGPRDRDGIIRAIKAGDFIRGFR